MVIQVIHMMCPVAFFMICLMLHQSFLFIMQMAAYGDPGDYNIAAVKSKKSSGILDYFNQQTRTYKLNGNVYADLKFLNILHFIQVPAGTLNKGN